MYSNGTVSVDTKTGNYFFNTTDFENPPVGDWGFYARRCKSNDSFYFPQEGVCTKSRPLPGQCRCLKGDDDARNCMLWAPSVFPNEIPTSATFNGYSTVNGYRHVQVVLYASSTLLSLSFHILSICCAFSDLGIF